MILARDPCRVSRRFENFPGPAVDPQPCRGPAAAPAQDLGVKQQCAQKFAVEYNFEAAMSTAEGSSVLQREQEVARVLSKVLRQKYNFKVI